MIRRFLTILAVFTLLTGSSLFTGPFMEKAAAAVSGYGLLADINAQRSAMGLAPLANQYQLTNAAQAKANDMVANNYWSHVSPSGLSTWYFLDMSGYSYLSAGENLAYGYSTSSGVVNGWMNSASHRANIANGSFSEVGFGIAYSANFQGSGPQTIVVAEFGQPYYAAPAPAPAPYVEPTPEPAPEPTYAPAPTEPIFAEPVESAPIDESPPSPEPVAETVPTAPVTTEPTPVESKVKNGKSESSRGNAKRRASDFKAVSNTLNTPTNIILSAATMGLLAPSYYLSRKLFLAQIPKVETTALNYFAS